MRLTFMGTPDFSVPALAALIAGGHDVVAVYTQPPRPAGRGKKRRPSPVQQFAESHDISVYNPLSLKGETEQQQFRDLNLDAAIVVAYGLILPKAILDAPGFGCINIHASLLPRWRGAAPIQRAIMAGDTETGVTIMAMDEGLDTGAMLQTSAIAIKQQDTAGTLHDKLSRLGADMICPVLKRLENDTITAVPQPATGVTYANKIKKTEARVNWHYPAQQIGCHIRGLSPFPGAWFCYQGARIKVLKATQCMDDHHATPGTVISTPLTVACAEGCLDLTELQREGKSAMSACDLIRGFPIPPGSRLDQESP